MVIVGVKRWVQFTTVALVAAGLLGAIIGSWRSSPTTPMRPEPCEEKADIRDSTDGAWHCAPPAHAEVYPMDNYRALFKCVCGTKAPVEKVSPQVIDQPLKLVEPTKLTFVK